MFTQFQSIDTENYYYLKSQIQASRTYAIYNKRPIYYIYYNIYILYLIYYYIIQVVVNTNVTKEMILIVHQDTLKIYIKKLILTPIYKKYVLNEITDSLYHIHQPHQLHVNVILHHILLPLVVLQEENMLCIYASMYYKKIFIHNNYDILIILIIYILIYLLFTQILHQTIP